jgi:hypothetical protein
LIKIPGYKNNFKGKFMIKSSFTYTKNELDTFLKYTLKKNTALKVVYVCSAIILVCAIYLLCLQDYVQGSLYLFCGLFFAFYGLILKAIGDKNNKKNVNNIDNYEFEEEKLTVYSFNAQGEQIATLIIKYDDIYKLMENGDRTYIFINKLVALIIAKENFENNDYQEVINRIKMKLPKKA